MKPSPGLRGAGHKPQKPTFGNGKTKNEWQGTLGALSHFNQAAGKQAVYIVKFPFFPSLFASVQRMWRGV